jgi:hypothetical protein
MASLITRSREIAPLITGGDVARGMLGQYLVLLSSAYDVVKTYDPLSLADEITDQGKEYLDGIRLRAEKDYALIPSGNAPLESKLQNQIAFDIASIEEATHQTLDIFNQTVFEDAKDWGIGLVKDAADKLPDLLPSSTTVWWFVAGLVVLVAWLKFGRR